MSLSITSGAVYWKFNTSSGHTLYGEKCNFCTEQMGESGDIDKPFYQDILVHNYCINYLHFKYEIYTW